MEAVKIPDLRKTSLTDAERQKSIEEIDAQAREQYRKATGEMASGTLREMNERLAREGQARDAAARVSEEPLRLLRSIESGQRQILRELADIRERLDRLERPKTE